MLQKNQAEIQLILNDWSELFSGLFSAILSLTGRKNAGTQAFFFQISLKKVFFL